MKEPMLYGVLVTFRRPDQLRAYLDCLLTQTRRLDRLIVVDNDSSPGASAAVDSYRERGGTAEYIDPGSNIGPAGGIAVGMNLVLDDAADDDWIFTLDDDDPPLFDDAIERSGSFATAMLEQDPRTGGVAPSGGRLNRRTGRLIRIGDRELVGPVRVDHFPGNGLPCYRVGAVREVGPFHADLFFGFEELEFGLRMTDAGFHLYSDGERWNVTRAKKRERGSMSEREVLPNTESTGHFRLAEPSWRRYYSMRNLVFILKAQQARQALWRVALVRGIFKPLANLPIDGSAWHQLSVNWKAIRDGWSGRLGLIVEPEVPPPG